MLTLVVKSSTRPRAAKAAKINKSQHYAKVNSSPALQMGCDALSDVAGKGNYQSGATHHWDLGGSEMAIWCMLSEPWPKKEIRDEPRTHCGPGGRRRLSGTAR